MAAILQDDYSPYIRTGKQNQRVLHVDANDNLIGDYSGMTFDELVAACERLNIRPPQLEPRLGVGQEEMTEKEREALVYFGAIDNE